jgi:hypothetical protein
MVIVLALHSGAGTFNFSAQNFCASALKNSSINSAFMPEPDRPNAREKYTGPLIHAIMVFSFSFTDNRNKNLSSLGIREMPKIELRDWLKFD